MKTMIRSPLAGLLLAFLVILGAGVLLVAAIPGVHLSFGAKALIALFTAGALFGTPGTVTYRSPAAVKGTSTAPSAAQVANCVIADVAMADNSTVTTVTHNLTGCSTDGTDGSPLVSVKCVVAGTTPVGAGVTVGYTTAAITLTSVSSAAGNGGTWRVEIWRHSLISDFVH